MCLVQGGIGLVVLLHVLSLICGIKRTGKGETRSQIQPRAIPKGKALLQDAQEWLWEGISVQGWGEVQNSPVATAWGSVEPSPLGW